jgi:hypothetical protein
MASPLSESHPAFAQLWSTLRPVTSPPPRLSTSAVADLHVAVRSLKHLFVHGLRESRRQLALESIQTCLRHLDAFAAAPLIRDGFGQAGVVFSTTGTTPISWSPPWTFGIFGFSSRTDQRQWEALVGAVDLMADELSVRYSEDDAGRRVRQRTEIAPSPLSNTSTTSTDFEALLVALFSWTPTPRLEDEAAPLRMNEQGVLIPAGARLPEFRELYSVYLTVFKAAPEPWGSDIKEYLIFLETMRVHGDRVVAQWDRKIRYAMAKGGPRTFKVATISHDFHTDAALATVRRQKTTRDAAEAARLARRTLTGAPRADGRTCFHFNSESGDTCTFAACSFPHNCDVCGGDHPGWSNGVRCTLEPSS